MPRDIVSHVLDYWFLPAGHAGHNRDRTMWFRGTPAIDADIARRFGALVAQALAGRLDHLAETPRGALALCLLLDQMTRNIFRGTSRAFAGDRRAQRIARQAIARGFDRLLPPVQRLFLYTPLHHSEVCGIQNRCVGLMWRLHRRGGLYYVIEHRNVVVRFGRFPHRNAVLGRRNSPAEEAYLSGPHERYGQ